MEMIIIRRETLSMYLIFAIALILAASAKIDASPSKVVVNSYTQCSKLSPELSSSCLANTGSREPFTYYEISNESDCYTFSDTTTIDHCIQKVKKHELFQIPKEETETKDLNREVIKTPIEQVASSTRTLVILSAINLGITAVGIAATAFIYFISN